jgi:hypothetical protein
VSAKGARARIPEIVETWSRIHAERLKGSPEWRAVSLAELRASSETGAKEELVRRLGLIMAELAAQDHARAVGQYDRINVGSLLIRIRAALEGRADKRWPRGLDEALRNERLLPHVLDHALEAEAQRRRAAVHPEAEGPVDAQVLAARYGEALLWVAQNGRLPSGLDRDDWSAGTHTALLVQHGALADHLIRFLASQDPPPGGGCFLWTPLGGQLPNDLQPEDEGNAKARVFQVKPDGFRTTYWRVEDQVKAYFIQHEWMDSADEDLPERAPRNLKPSDVTAE